MPTPELDGAVAAMRAFIEDEAAAQRAMLLEPDEAIYRAAEARAESHLHVTGRPRLSLGFGRSPGRPPTAADDQERAYAEGLGARVLFAVARHERAGRPVFRAYTADPAVPSMYVLVFNLAEVDGALKIVGKASSDRRGPPDELAWRPLGGDQLDDAGPVLEAAKLQRPTHAPSAAHWDGLPDE